MGKVYLIINKIENTINKIKHVRKNKLVVLFSSEIDI